MATQTKEDLLNVTDKEFKKLQKLIVTISSEQALDKDDDDTSIKDVIAHRAHWIDLFFGWYHDGLAKKEVFFPAKGYKWNQLKRYNAQLRRTQSELTWLDAQDLLVDRHYALSKFIESASNNVLYSGPMQGTKSHWTTGRWVEAVGPSHYRSAAKYVRSRLRSMT